MRPCCLVLKRLHKASLGKEGEWQVRLTSQKGIRDQLHQYLQVWPISLSPELGSQARLLGVWGLPVLTVWPRAPSFLQGGRASELAAWPFRFHEGTWQLHTALCISLVVRSAFLGVGGVFLC
jgi:hypothetical protein